MESFPTKIEFNGAKCGVQKFEQLIEISNKIKPCEDIFQFIKESFKSLQLIPNKKDGNIEISNKFLVENNKNKLQVKLKGNEYFHTNNISWNEQSITHNITIFNNNKLNSKLYYIYFPK
jgi:subtilase family serine protease